MTPSTGRQQSIGTNSSRQQRSRRASSASHASTTLTAPDQDIFDELRTFVRSRGWEDVFAVMIFRKREEHGPGSRPRSNFYGTGICLHCQNARAYETNMCRHLSECQVARAYLDDRPSQSVSRIPQSSAARHHSSPRAFNYFRPLRPQINTTTDAAINQPHYQTDHLSPEDARNHPWFNSRQAISAPASHLDPLEIRRPSELDRTLSEAPLSVAAHFDMESTTLPHDTTVVPSGNYDHLLRESLVNGSNIFQGDDLLSGLNFDIGSLLRQEAASLDPSDLEAEMDQICQLYPNTLPSFLGQWI
ncbi:hypothetical protein C1H76_6977 [Elsinoe australis]|uniref:Uncharacterized protein n=1 Tax=Elsinoe australis TaxID=40998 RepID=A0A4U7AWC6_9PEZI|nr:hypothetical protein C1H76_6977 [Elsinoe australis]